MHDEKLTMKMNKDDIVKLIEGWLAFDEEFSDLVLGVVQNLKTKQREMDLSLRNGDYKQLKDQIHGLKGLTGNLNMLALYSFFLELDTYVKAHEGSDQRVENQLDVFRDFVEKIPSSYDERVILPPRPDGPVDLSILLGGTMKTVTDGLIKLSYDYDIYIESAKDGMELLEKFYMETFDMVIFSDDLGIVSSQEVVQTLNSHQTSTPLEIVQVMPNQRNWQLIRDKAIELIGGRNNENA